MDNQMKRRDFLKVMGAGTAALGAGAVGCAPKKDAKAQAKIAKLKAAAKTKKPEPSAKPKQKKAPAKPKALKEEKTPEVMREQISFFD